MNLEPRPEVVTQDHADVHPPEGVELDGHGAGPERRRHVASPNGVTAAGHDSGSGRQRIGVSQEDHIQSIPPQHAGGCPRGTLTLGPVEHFHCDPSLWSRDWSLSHRLGLGTGPQHQSQGNSEQH